MSIVQKGSSDTEFAARRSLRSSLAIGLTCLAVVVVLVNANIIFMGETLVATANFSPIDDRWPGRNHRNWHDQGAVWWQWEPAGQFFGRAYRAGELPLWDPTAAGGVDAHVNVTQGQYFLPYVALLLAGNTPMQRDLYYLLILLASGFACFVLLRRNGFHMASAVFMGTAWMLGGTMTQNVNAFLGQTYAMLPWLVLVVDWLLDTLRWRALGVAALAVGLCTYSSFLPIVISGYVLIGIQAGVYALMAARTAKQTPWVALLRLSAVFAIAVALALGIAAIILVPLMEAQRDSASFHTYYTGIGQMAYPWDLVPSLLSPRLFYDVWQTEPYTAAFIPKLTWYSTHYFYVGAVVVLLLSFVRRDERIRVRRLTWFFAVAAALFFLKLMGIPPVQWIAYLPVFKFLHFIPYFSGAFALALVGLAACGVEALVTHSVRPRRFLAAMATTAAVMATVPVFIWVNGYNHAATARITLLYFLEIDRVVAVLVSLLGIAYFRMRQELRGSTAGVLAILLVIVELGPLAFERRPARADVWNDRLPEYVRFLQQDREQFRIHSIDNFALPPNTFQGVGIAAINSLGVFNESRFTALIEAFFKTELNSGFIITSSLLPTSRPVLDLLNVKYVVTCVTTPEKQAELAAVGLKLVLTDGNFSVFRNPTVWPRAFVAHDYYVGPNATEAMKSGVVPLAQDVAVLEARPTFAPGGGPATAAQIRKYRPNQVVVSGDDSTPGMLVLLDSFGEGWSATVNGKTVSIVPAYGAFRGVEVPAGRWEVTMRYEVPRLRAALVLAMVALAVAVVAIFLRRDLPGASQVAVSVDSGKLGDP